MTETKEKRKRNKEFAGIVDKLLTPLQEEEWFQDFCKGVYKKVCLNPTDGRYAALLTIDDGKITVEGIRNTPKENLSKKILGWNGRVMMSTETFLRLVRGEFSLERLMVKVISRKIKVKSAKTILFLLKIINLRLEHKEPL